MSYWRKITLLTKDYAGINLLRDYIDTAKSKDAVFIWIPKTAGTSIHIALNARKKETLQKIRFRFCNRGVVTFGHMNYAELVKQHYISKEFDRNSFKFAIARNPYDRAVSLYTYLKSRNKIPTTQSFLSFLRHLADNGCPQIGIYHTKDLSQCNPQIRWIEYVNIDFLGHLESLQNDIQIIAKNLGISDIHMPHKNASRRKNTEQYFCMESIDIVEYLYSEDFKHLNYNKMER